LSPARRISANFGEEDEEEEERQKETERRQK